MFESSYIIRLQEYEFRVELDLGLQRGSAQLLVDAALEGRFDVCDRVVAFYGEANIAPDGEETSIV